MTGIFDRAIFDSAIFDTPVVAPVVTGGGGGGGYTPAVERRWPERYRPEFAREREVAHSAGATFTLKLVAAVGWRPAVTGKTLTLVIPERQVAYSAGAEFVLRLRFAGRGVATEPDDPDELFILGLT